MLALVSAVAASALSAVAASNARGQAAGAQAGVSSGAGADAEVAVSNFVRIDGSLATSGQLSPAAIRELRDHGIDVVISVVPPHTAGWMPDEGQRVRAAGAAFLNVPVSWDAPVPEDFDRVADAIGANRARHVIVHCGGNYRSSVMTFLYRVIRERAPPEAEWRKVLAVWVPNATWMRYVRETLRAHGVSFDPM